MKLLVITAIEEYQKDVVQLLQQADISIFSLTETKGIKTESNELDLHAWFGNKSGEYQSIFAFSFASENQAQKALELIDEWNVSNTKFPIRGFLLPVEKTTK